MTYKVYLSTKLSPTKLSKGSGVIALEPDDYKNTDIKAIRAKGYKVLAYLSIGTIEKERSWFRTYSKYKLKRLSDWPNEYYMDMTKTAWQKFLVSRAKALQKRGFDGWVKWLTSSVNILISSGMSMSGTKRNSHLL